MAAASFGARKQVVRIPAERARPQVLSCSAARYLNTTGVGASGTGCGNGWMFGGLRAILPFGIVVTSTNATTLNVIDTSVIDSFGAGIQLQPLGGPVVNVVLDRVNLNNSLDSGILVLGSSGATTRVQITNSTISDNLNWGVYVQTGAQPATVVVASSLLSGNGTGVFAQGAAAAVLLNGNTITNNATAMSVNGGGAIFSYGNNAVNDNGSPGTAPTPVALR